MGEEPDRAKTAAEIDYLGASNDLCHLCMCYIIASVLYDHSIMYVSHTICMMRAESWMNIIALLKSRLSQNVE